MAELTAVVDVPREEGRPGPARLEAPMGTLNGRSGLENPKIMKDSEIVWVQPFSVVHMAPKSSGHSHLKTELRYYRPTAKGIKYKH
jgi:hypothetical protein